MTPNINIIDLAEKHGQTSYRNRAYTKHPAYGFTEEGLQAFAHALLAAAPQAVQPAVPVIFVSREQLESHTDHLASEAGRYLPARKSAVGKFTMPLYAHPADAVQAAVSVDVVSDLKNALADAAEMQRQLRLMEEHARGDVWRWQADAANELASMGNRMGVLILASDLRNLLAAPAHPAEGVPALEVNDAMALAFHHALTDGSIGADDLEEIKIGLRAVLANVAATQPAAQPVATITGLDEFGPCFGWHEHWAKFPVGTNFYTQPAAQGLDAQDLDAWKCEKCNGTGIHKFDGYGDSPRGQYPITEREECDDCNATGWCGPDAALAAQAKQGGA